MSILQSLAVVAAQQGKTIVAGSLTPSSADEEVVTGLTTVDHCFVSMAAQPDDDHSQSSANPAATAGSIRIRSYKPTGGASAVPIAATAFGKVYWIAVGSSGSTGTLIGAMRALPVSPRWRLASGTETSTGGQADIVTGLAAISFVLCAPKGVPTLDHSQNSAEALAEWGQFRIRSQGSTSSGDATPAQSVASVARSWLAIGT